MNRRRTFFGAGLFVLAVLSSGQAGARLDDSGKLQRRSVAQFPPASTLASLAPLSSVAAVSSIAPVAAGQPAPDPRLGQRVRDALKATPTVSGAIQQASSPELLRLADDDSAYITADGRVFFVEQSEGSQAQPEEKKQADVSNSESFIADPQVASSQTNALPTNALPTNALPTNALPTNALPTNALPTNALPNKLPAIEQAAVEKRPASEAFFLNSRPGAERTIYLDFDGAIVAGTGWNSSIPSKTVQAYDRDGNASSFSEDEKTWIVGVWRRVAEDFAPWSVNVTTQLPSPDALSRTSFSDQTFGSRVIITNDKWLCPTGCGGLAFLRQFTDVSPNGNQPDPAWVFPNESATETWSAVTISHEVGHNLGLSHDGVRTGGVSTAEYYSGHAAWVPIMGAGSTRTFSQWSRGEYSNASNTEDDLAIISTQIAQAPDLSSDFSNAQYLGNSDEVVSAQHVIHSQSDVDFYSFDSSSGFIEAFVATPTAGWNMLQRVSLYNSSGDLVASNVAQPGADVSLEYAPAAPGRYVVSVSGAGFASPLDTGFSSYGSIGFYSVRVRQIDKVSSPAFVALTPSLTTTLTASWPAGTSRSNRPVNYRVTLCTSGGACLAPVVTQLLSYSFDNLTPSSLYTAEVEAGNVLGVGLPQRSALQQVVVKPVAPALSKLIWDPNSRALTIEWCCGSSFQPVVLSDPVVTVTHAQTGQQLVAVQASGGSAVVVIPPNWGTSPVAVLLKSSVSAPYVGTPWDVTPAVPAQFFFSEPATVANPTAPVTPRGNAPSASGNANPQRGQAPQS
jgi:hypothetical protein